VARAFTGLTSDAPRLQPAYISVRRYQDAGPPLLLHMRHQRHEKAGDGTRLVTAALVLIVGAGSLAAAPLLVKHSTSVHGTQARHDEPPPPDSPRKDGGRRATDMTPPRLRLPGRIARIAHGPSGVIVRYASSAVDRRDGRVAARCSPASGSRFHPGITAVRCSATDRSGNVAHSGFAVVVRTMPGSTPPLLCFPADPCDATRQYAAWTFDR
jgi:hypothetical protein